MYYLFYGENSYLIREKTKALEAKFREKHGVEAMVVKLDGDKLTKEALAGALFGVSIFSPKQLVIIRNLLLSKPAKDVADFLSANLNKISPDTVVIFVEDGMPDARTSLFKKLNQPKQAQQFSKLTPATLRSWVKQRVTEAGGSIEPAAVEKLEAYTGGNLWRLSQEIEKLALFRSSQASNLIREADIELLIQAENNESVFTFIEALAQKNKQRALVLLHRLIEQGENEQYLLSMIVYQYRQMLIIADLLARKVPANQVASQAKIHPYVVQKTMASLKHISWEELKLVYRKLEDCDIAIKTGARDERLAIDLLLLDICNT